MSFSNSKKTVLAAAFAIPAVASAATYHLNTPMAVINRHRFFRDGKSKCEEDRRALHFSDFFLLGRENFVYFGLIFFQKFLNFLFGRFGLIF